MTALRKTDAATVDHVVECEADRDGVAAAPVEMPNHAVDPKTDPRLKLARAKVRRPELRMRAWSRVLVVVGVMRAALDHRIYLENPEDVALEHDARNFCELALALSDYLKAKRA